MTENIFNSKYFNSVEHDLVNGLEYSGLDIKIIHEHGKHIYQVYYEHACISIDSTVGGWISIEHVSGNDTTPEQIMNMNFRYDDISSVKYDTGNINIVFKNKTELSLYI